ncbi:uncharacterized protein LOC111324315 [Stylophora pistillata]|uniref:Uncharacterized protein n=1 Tax=Stylophora pistillata TaxID=50429 RepID=A0A2B4SMV4_STYPI|nr:uncharacterized protein LOC111324315 [Stylophora pistillata]XP_022783582.1 uncharacterized protein LOC111324315 [Stylophora pistillata]PFX29852.1 hypothetical protein AWC38_SpisGene5347 [Stylophora pistillata]
MQSGETALEMEQVPAAVQMGRHAPLREEPPKDHFILAVVSVFFCPLIGVLAVCMSRLTNLRYEEDDIKRAQDASKDAWFSAFLAIFLGVSIVFFFIFIEAIVPSFA